MGLLLKAEWRKHLTLETSSTRNQTTKIMTSTSAKIIENSVIYNNLEYSRFTIVHHNYFPFLFLNFNQQIKNNKFHQLQNTDQRKKLRQKADNYFSYSLLGGLCFLLFTILDLWTSYLLFLNFSDSKLKLESQLD